MSHRDRPGSVGVAPPPPAARAALPRHGPPPAGESWDDLFPALLPVRQAELLALAARQGLLAARQLPVPDYAPGDRARSFFSGLFAPGGGDPLLPYRPEPLDLVDSQLDAEQRDAASRALYTPDVCLISGAPGTGKTRLIAEIARQAARRGQRVLLTAPTAAPIDAVLARLDDDPNVVTLRGVGREEPADELPAPAASRTFAAIRRRLIDGAAIHARQVQQQAADRLGRLRADLALLPDLERRARAAAELNGNGAPAADSSESEAELARVDADAARCAADLQRIRKRAAELDAQLAAHAADPPPRGWLARLFGPARPAAPVDQWRTEREELRCGEDRAQRQVDDLAARRDALLEQCRLERQARSEEAQRRRESAAAERAALAAEAQRLAAGLSTNGALRDPLDLEALRRAADDARRASTECEAEEAAAARWSDFFVEHGRELPMRLLQCVSLAAAPLAALTADDALAELTRDGPFDLLIFDDAHRASEADLLHAARRARRWVLIGEPADAEPPAHDPQSARQTPRGGTRVSAWVRLWRQLHQPAWRIEHGRPCARLAPLTALQAATLDAEPVADAPDVELRIGSPACGEPRLAEVAFAAGTTARDAFAFLHREVGELPAPCAAAQWDEQPGLIRCRFLAGGGEPLELEPGVRLSLAGVQIAAIEFDTAAGWSRERAEEWARTTLKIGELGRTAELVTQYRMGTGPAAFAAALGFAVAAPPTSPVLPVADFVPVPALSEPQARRRGDVGLNGQQRRLPPLRGGAGLDLDLADPKQRERLPPELRDILPPRGFVNLPEAEGIVRVLETLLDDLPAQRPDAILVLPMYAAQAALARALAARSSLLAAAPVPVHIAAAADAGRLEADWVVIGLTRSHGHRAVSYGDGPADMVAAVTRARARVIVVGDPGTLARRAHWDGPLDHLDADAARRERDWVAALVRLLQGHGPPTVHLCEGPP